MHELKWYKSKRKLDDLLTMVLVDDIKTYYSKESTTDQTKLYTALGNYYIKTTDFDRLSSYLGGTVFEECGKPARKNLSPL
ncbi:MAG: hypothetical protein H7141_12085 [Burkholderiales bacterium]|nr:hypothetical protein [Bacteroidia bacterium]